MDLTGFLEIAGRTDAGQVRTQNEDSIGEEVELGAIILADGMGGYHGGEVASAIAVNTVLNYLHEHIPTFLPGQTDKKADLSKESLHIREAITQANTSIVKASETQPQYRGMGTTVVMGIFYDNRITVAHVGDSRMYRFRDDLLEHITVDHTLLQELVDRGFYTEQEARESLNKNLVTRALGIDKEVIVDIKEMEALPGDIYLLCSDGLNDMISDEDIRSTISAFSANLQDTADNLIKLANEKGGRDNVSVVLARPLMPFPAPSIAWYKRLFSFFY
jgi:protein phosphatase